MDLDPIVTGALVGLVAVVGGLVAVPGYGAVFVSGALGGVATGATAAWLSELDLETQVGNAIGADIARAVLLVGLFVATVYVGLPIDWTSGLVGSADVPSVVLFGSVVAIQMGFVSLTVAAITGFVVGFSRQEIEAYGTRSE